MSAGHQKQVERRRDRDAQKAAQKEQDRHREVPLNEAAERLVATHALSAEFARGLAAHPKLATAFESSIGLGAEAKAVAALLLGDVAREMKSHPEFTISAERVKELTEWMQEGRVTSHAAKQIIAELRKGDRSVETIVSELGVQRVDDQGTLLREIDEVLRAFAPKVEAYRAGNQNLMGLFVGQVMQRTRGRADPVVVQRLLRERLSS
jgi:aspartyl-tRNA(Asn)/glutamyl-tRNA(Gln) amidotransferase subunit B